MALLLRLPHVLLLVCVAIATAVIATAVIATAVIATAVIATAVVVAAVLRSFLCLLRPVLTFLFSFPSTLVRGRDRCGSSIPCAFAIVFSVSRGGR